MSRKLWITLIIITLALVGSLSFYLHHPDTPTLTPPGGKPEHYFGLKYSDISHLYDSIFKQDKSDRWINETSYKLFLSSNYTCPVPYRDYKFEYPPVIGSIWYITTCLAFTIDRNASRTINYIAQSSILLFFYSLLAFTIYKLIKYLRSQNIEELSYKRMLLLASPSFIMYLIYNWDVIAITFALLGILFYFRNRYLSSGLLLGLSISTKILTAGIAVYILAKIAVSGNKRGLIRYLLGLLASGILPFVIFYAAFTRGYIEFVNHHLRWYCENCIYLPLVGRDIFSPLSRHLFMSMATFSLFLFITVFLPWKTISIKTELNYLLLALLSLIVLNYVFPPQMFIMISPLALITLSGIPLVLLVITDIANAILIISFFIEAYTMGPSWVFGSVTQYFALIRNLILLSIMIYLLYMIGREKILFIQGGNVDLPNY